MARPTSDPAGTPHRGAGPAGSGLRKLGDLSVVAGSLEPCELLRELGELLSPGRPLELASARHVGVTSGVWILTAEGPGNAWLLKRVTAQRIRPNLPTDVEHCKQLAKTFPTLLSDPRLAFPHSYIDLRQGSKLVGQLLISRVMPGDQLGRFVAFLDLTRPQDQQRLEGLCGSVGGMLADFHIKYADPTTREATNHRDFHPSNVLYDEATGTISFVDLSGMGTWGPNDDVEKFTRVMAQLAGERFAQAFSQRYHAEMKRRGFPVTHKSSASAPPKTRLLYPATRGEASPGFQATDGSVFCHLSTLVVPPGPFNPATHLTTLTWILSPSRRVARPAVEKVPVSGGAWLLASNAQPEDRWLLRTASASRRSPELPTEAEEWAALAEELPGLLTDRRLVCPHAVVPLQSDGQHAMDLLVARAAPGIPLDQHLSELDLGNAQVRRSLEKVCKGLGSLLATFHLMYAGSGKVLQHRDLDLSSVLYDKASGTLCLVCLSGLSFDAEGPGEDTERLASTVRSRAGGRYASAFRAGYGAEAKAHGTDADRRRLRTDADRRRLRGLGAPMWPWCASQGGEAASDSESGESDTDTMDQSGRHCRVM